MRVEPLKVPIEVEVRARRRTVGVIQEAVVMRRKRFVACATIDGNTPPAMLYTYLPDNQEDLSKDRGWIVGSDGQTVEFMVDDLRTALAVVDEALFQSETRR